MSEAVRICQVEWGEYRTAIRFVRDTVFVKEQHVPEEIERDGLDGECYHVLALDWNHNPVGTARMQKNGHLGRIAVLSPWRRRGIGSQLVGELIKISRTLGLQEVDLNAQTHAMEFYRRLHFQARGEVFHEANIPHRNMFRIIAGPLEKAISPPSPGH